MYLREYWEKRCDKLMENEKKIYQRILMIGMAGGVLSSLCLLLIHLGFSALGYWIYDEKVMNFIKGLRGPNLNNLFIVITSTGNNYPVIATTIIIVIILWKTLNRRAGLFFGINILGIWLLNELLKSIFQRHRPMITWLVDAPGYSLPSGHSMNFMTLCLLSIFFLFLYNKKRSFKIITSSLIFLYAVAVGLSRVYVGVHYISDVITGWSLAFLWTSISIIVFTTIEIKIANKK